MDFGEDIDLKKEIAKAEEEQRNGTPAEIVEETPDVPVILNEPAPESETHEEPAGEPAKEPEKPKTGDVNVALREARREAKELKAALKKKEAEDSAKYAELQAKLDAIKNPPAEKPAFDTQPAEYLKDKVEAIEKQTSEIAQRNEQSRIESVVSGALTNSEKKFAEEHADYQDAAKHLIDGMDRNLQLLGVEDQQQRTQSIRMEVLKLTAAAMKNGKEPAELMYELAKNSGFTGKKAKAASTEKLETIEKGQAVSQSLGSGTRADTGKLTLDSLAKMDDDDFNSLVSDDKKWKEIGRLMH